jgi:hypothetical protein
MSWWWLGVKLLLARGSKLGSWQLAFPGSRYRFPDRAPPTVGDILVNACGNMQMNNVHRQPFEQ